MIIIVEFSTETMHAKREWNEISKAERKKTQQTRILYLAKLFLKVEKKYKDFLRQILKEFLTSTPVLQTTLKEIFQREGK